MAILDLGGGTLAAMAVGLFIAFATYLIWVLSRARLDRPRRLRWPLRPVARCTLLGDAIQLRQLVPRVAAALAKADDGLKAGPATYRQPSCSLVLFEGERPHPFLLVLGRVGRSRPGRPDQIELELCSQRGTPPARRTKPSKRVLEAVERALRSLAELENVQWSRDRRHWHVRPFES